MLATQRTLRNNPCVWHRHYRCRYVFAAAFAPHSEVADPCLGQLPHRNSIGEYKANICTVVDFCFAVKETP